jgi:hypothetical protein
VEATRRISPRLLVELLTLTGPQVTAYFQSRDPFVLGEAVSWAGDAPAPVWLDVAREYSAGCTSSTSGKLLEFRFSNSRATSRRFWRRLCTRCP